MPRQKEFYEKISIKLASHCPYESFWRCPMKKLTFVFSVVALAMIPTLLLAQPPRPRSGQTPHAQSVVVQPAARPTLQVHTPSPQVVTRGPAAGQHHHPAYHPAYRPTVVQPRVVVLPPVIASPPMITAPIVTPAVVTPYYPGYYYPSGNGFSLTIGGRNGVFSLSTGY